jgi:mono/diheme cytochrome c family protein
LKGETSGDAKRGQEFFQSAGCISCHQSKLPNQFKAASLTEIAKSDFSRGCVAKSAEARGKAPAFSLDDDQRAALAQLAKTQFASLARDTAAEFAERQITQLNCAACHQRDKTDDTFSQLQSEIDALVSKLPEEKGNAELGGDQSRPPLTWAGEKLRPEWMAKFIAGDVSYKPRPWLAARMPGFPARAKGIAVGLTQQHGCPSTPPPNVPPDAQLAAEGMKLVNKTGGFSCIQCHSVGGMRALAPFEAPAINFSIVTDRLTKEFYDRWVYNPQRVVPGTRMPQFSGSDGKTALKDSFDGDARKQFDAIWNYLLAGEKITPPPKQ